MPTEDEELRAICDDISSRQRYRAGPKRMADVVNELMARRGYAQLQSSAACAIGVSQEAVDRRADKTDARFENPGRAISHRSGGLKAVVRE